MVQKDLPKSVFPDVSGTSAQCPNFFHDDFRRGAIDLVGFSPRPTDAEAQAGEIRRSDLAGTTAAA